MVTVVVDGVVTSSYRYTTLEDVTLPGGRGEWILGYLDSPQQCAATPSVSGEDVDRECGHLEPGWWWIRDSRWWRLWCGHGVRVRGGRTTNCRLVN